MYHALCPSGPPLHFRLRHLDPHLLAQHCSTLRTYFQSWGWRINLRNIASLFPKKCFDVPKANKRWPVKNQKRHSEIKYIGNALPSLSEDLKWSWVYDCLCSNISKVFGSLCLAQGHGQVYQSPSPRTVRSTEKCGRCVLQGPLGPLAQADHKPQLWFWSFCPDCWDSASLMAQQVKNSLAMQETQEMQVWSLGQDDPWRRKMATHSSILAWKIPWTEEPGMLKSVGSQRVGNDWVTNTCKPYLRTQANAPVLFSMFFCSYQFTQGSQPCSENC